MKTNARYVKRCACLSGSLLSCAGALLLCFLTMLAIEQRVAAASFPGGPDDDANQISVGVFRIIVAPEFRTLLAPQAGPPVYQGYIGYHSADGRLTSPMLIDFTTQIGRGNPHSRPNPPDLGDYPWYSYFPDAIGLGSWDWIQSYADYPAVPPMFAAPANQTAEVLTEIKSFILATWLQNNCTNALAPIVPTNWAMVIAGKNLVGVQSLGMVQEITANGTGNNDYPANSFFDVFVNINLPALPNTYSIVAFPGPGAILYNKDALIITNLGINTLPPQVTYMHGGNTNAVDLYFKFDNHPYWSADDYFGSLVLAGHGIVPYDDCYYEQAVVTDTLGTPGALRPELPPEWARTSSVFPSPAVAYEVVKMDTNPPAASYDSVSFNVGGTYYYAHNLSLGKLSNSIAPPLPGYGTTCTSSNAQMTLQLSQDGYNFYSTSPTGSVKLSITNYTGSSNVFTTKIEQMNYKGTWPYGPIYLRQSHTATNASVGQHTCRSAANGYRVSSFFDVWLEISTDNSTWYAANRPLRMLASAPAPRPLSLYIDNHGNNVVLKWINSFPLQSTTNLISGTWTDVAGVTNAPYTNGIGPSAMFFRLRQ